MCSRRKSENVVPMGSGDYGKHSHWSGLGEVRTESRYNSSPGIADIITRGLISWKIHKTAQKKRFGDKAANSLEEAASANISPSLRSKARYSSNAYILIMHVQYRHFKLYTRDYCTYIRTYTMNYLHNFRWHAESVQYLYTFIIKHRRYTNIYFTWIMMCAISLTQSLYH